MSYTAQQATRQLLETPSSTLVNWPWVLIFTGTNIVSDMLVGEPTITFDPRVDSFSDSATLRRTLFECVVQGTQDLAQTLIWNGGYQTSPPVPTSEAYNQPAMSAYY